METARGFNVIFQEIEDGWYFARCLEVPEAITQGATLEEARENIRDAISLILEDRREDAGREFEGRDDVIREHVSV
jgi:predicted RNase H-like HicB family nuclease